MLETLPSSLVAPAVVKVAKTENRIVRGAKKVGMWLRIARVVKQEARELIEDSCDVDEPEVCADENKMKAKVKQLSKRLP